MLRLLLYCCLAVVFAKEEFEVSYSSGEKAVDPFFDANQAVVHKRNVGFARESDLSLSLLIVRTSCKQTRNNPSTQDVAEYLSCQDEGGTVNGLTCLQIFQATGIKFCDHVDLSRKCCATRWRYCGDCKDTPNIRVNEMTCHDFFMKTGQTACHRGDVAGVCCASRRKVCDNCYGDTTNVLLGNMTCSELISKVGLAACHHHQVIQHCCLTRGVMCECNGDHLGTSFSDKDGNTFTCATIFSDNKFDVCRSPTVLQGCCKSFREHCKDSPILG